MKYNTLDELVKACRNSSFNQISYDVSIPLEYFFDSLQFHTWYDRSKLSKRHILSSLELDELFERMTPAFQRSNDCWSQDMQIRFVENILRGAKTELLFYRFDEVEDSLVLDGLQRLTALSEFFKGNLTLFGMDGFDLTNPKFLRMVRSNISIKIYTFNSIVEVVRFYVEMNEGVTHSKSDIQKAKDWLFSETGVQL